MRAVKGASGRAGFLLGLTAILLVAAWVRISAYQAVLGTGELVPRIDGDSHYHLDRALDAAANFPRVRHFDPWMNWPAGAFCPWADGFDLAAAGFALVARGGDPSRAPLAIALWPVVLGILSVWLAVRLLRTALPGGRWQGAALAAGLALAMLPISVVHSSFGRIDHHVFEAVVVTLLATWVLRRFPAHPGAPAPPALRFELEGALISGLGVYGFTGAPLYVAVAVCPLALAAYGSGAIRGSGGAGLLAGGALSAALSVPAALDHQRWLSFKYPSLLQPGLLLVGGATILAAGWVGSERLGRRRARPLAVAVAGLVAAGGCAAAAPGAVAEVHGAVTGWLLHQDPWISSIREFKPLFSVLKDGVPAWSRLYWALGFSGFFLPVAGLVVAATQWRRPRVRVLLWFTLALTALALVQTRFDRAAAPLLAAVTAVAVAVALRAISIRWGRPCPWAAASVVMGALFLADPPSRANLFLAGPIVGDPVQESVEALREWKTTAGPAPGVLSNWSYGHQLQVQAGVPVAVNGFGSYLDEAAFWRAVDVFSGEPSGLDELMVSQRLGALVAGAATIGQEVTGAGDSLSFANGQLNKAYMTSIPTSPLLIAGSAVPGWSVPHLPHLMPIHASQAFVAGLSFPLPFLWVFERVPGATIRGSAPPEARVVAELRFTEHRRPHTYKAFASADAQGAWSLVLPFPSGLVRPAFVSAPRWSVTAPGCDSLEFELTEQAVRGGDTIELAPLGPKP